MAGQLIASPFKQETKIDKENLPKASDTHKTAQAQPWFKNEQDELQVRKISLSVESELAFIENLLFWTFTTTVPGHTDISLFQGF